MHSIAIFISRSYHSIGDLKSKGLKIIGVQCPIESHFASRTGNLLLSCWFGVWNWKAKEGKYVQFSPNFSWWWILRIFKVSRTPVYCTDTTGKSSTSPPNGASTGLEKSPVRGKNSTPPLNGASTRLEKSPVCGKNSTPPHNGASTRLEKSLVRGKNSTPPQKGASTGLEKSPVRGKNDTSPPNGASTWLEQSPVQ